MNHSTSTGGQGMPMSAGGQDLPHRTDSSVGFTTNPAANENITSPIIEIRWSHIHSLHGVKVVSKTKLDAALLGASLNSCKDLGINTIENEYDGELTHLLYAADPKKKLDAATMRIQLANQLGEIDTIASCKQTTVYCNGETQKKKIHDLFLHEMPKESRVSMEMILAAGSPEKGCVARFYAPLKWRQYNRGVDLVAKVRTAVSLLPSEPWKPTIAVRELAYVRSFPTRRHPTEERAREVFLGIQKEVEQMGLEATMPQYYAQGAVTKLSYDVVGERAAVLDFRNMYEAELSKVAGGAKD